MVGRHHNDPIFSFTDYKLQPVQPGEYPFEQILSSGKGKMNMELAMKPLSGGGVVRKLAVNGEMVYLSETMRRNVVLFLSDVTEQLEWQETLLKAKDEAEEAANAKSAFLSSMSHELRTPMNGIVGMVNLLRDTSPLSTEQLEYMENIQNCADLLLSIINEVLDFSKMEYNMVELETIPFNLGGVVGKSLEVVTTNLFKKIEVMWLIAENVPYVVCGDPTRCSTAFHTNHVCVTGT